MRDGARLTIVHCKMTETAVRADCDVKGRMGVWKVIASEKQVPISPMNWLKMLSSGRVNLFNHTQQLRADDMATETLEERINLSPEGSCPSQEGRSAFREAYTKLTVRKVVIWRHQATESLIKKMVTLGANNVLPNFVAGGMDAAEGTLVWNYTVRSCQEEELEELYNRRIGVFKTKNGNTKGRSVVLDGFGSSQRAWLKTGQGATICGRKMRQTHLPHVYVEWNNLDWKKDESLRLEWSYLVVRDDHILRRTLQ
jgi:hypothetical protein